MMHVDIFYVFYVTQIQSYAKYKFFLLLTFKVFLSNVNWIMAMENSIFQNPNETQQYNATCLV